MGSASQESILKGPASRFLRVILQMPLWLYRLRLGFLLGRRFLLLTHIGRKSGLPRQAVLEVARHDGATGTYVIASGWGEGSDWFRNIQKTPNVVVTVGLERFAAKAVRLSGEAAEQEFLDYARRHPRAFRALGARLLRQPSKDPKEKCRLLARAIPLVALCPVAILDEEVREGEDGGP